jgi:hypothetical protein
VHGRWPTIAPPTGPGRRTAVGGGYAGGQSPLAGAPLGLDSVRPVPEALAAADQLAALLPGPAGGATALDLL